MISMLAKVLGSFEEPFWKEIGLSQRTRSGQRVSEDSAMNYSAYYRGVALISGRTATLPIHIYKRVNDSTRARQSKHNIERLLNKRPNPLMDAVTFRETLQMHVHNWGNGFAEKQTVGAQIAALWPLHPSTVKVDTDDSGLVYEITRPGNRKELLSPDRIFHLKNLGGDGLVGWSTIRCAREGIGLGLATESYGAQFFGNGSRPGGVLKHPGKLSEKAQGTLRHDWKRIHGAANDGAHETAILCEGMEWQQTSISPEDSQFLETRKFQVTEIARWLGIAPHLLGDLEHATFTNIEAQGLEFLIYCLSYWLDKWQAAVNTQLLLESEQNALYSEFVTDAIVKADINTRFNAYGVARSTGWMNVNEIRQKENLPPIGPEGDVYLVPANMLPASSLLEPVDPEPEQTPPQNDTPNEPTPTSRMQEVDDSFKQLWNKSLRELQGYECNQIRKAAKHAKDFLSRVQEVYVKLEAMMVDKLAPIALSWRLAVPGVLVGETTAYAHQYCAVRQLELVALSGECTATELLPKVEEWLAS